MVRSKLILIGYWWSELRPHWPRPEAFIDHGWDPDERELVSEYLARGFVARAYMGYSRCRMCGENNGALELSDGSFVWPDGLAHYVREHDVRLPAHFVEHALSRLDELESAERDEDWWLTAKGNE